MATRSRGRARAEVMEVKQFRCCDAGPRRGWVGLRKAEKSDAAPVARRP